MLIFKNIFYVYKKYNLLFDTGQKILLDGVSCLYIFEAVCIDEILWDIQSQFIVKSILPQSLISAIENCCTNLN